LKSKLLISQEKSSPDTPPSVSSVVVVPLVRLLSSSGRLVRKLVVRSSNLLTPSRLLKPLRLFSNLSNPSSLIASRTAKVSPVSLSLMVTPLSCLVRSLLSPKNKLVD
ncbi:hypothetical protein K7432_017102, partial [Basidiobolus ranarum]